MHSHIDEDRSRRSTNREEARDPTPRIPGVAKDNIQSITQIEQKFVSQRSNVDRLSEAIAGFAGSFEFVLAQMCALAAWLAINSGAIGSLTPFDPYPFSFLALLVALEAVLLSTFVLMTQKRQSRQAEHWAHLTLQIGLLTERESTKTLQMLTTISNQLGLKTSHDTELNEMVEKTAVTHLAKELADNLDKTREVDKSRTSEG